MTTTFTGNNSFLLRTELQKRVAAFTAEHGDLALERLDAAEVEYEQILGAIESLPFLVSKKMVVIEHISLNKTAIEALEKLVERAGDTTDLVIVEFKPDKRSALYKQLKKITDFHEYNEPDENQLVSWITEQQKGINRADASYLVQRVGLNQLRLSMELQKLAQYNPKITKQSIDLLVDENPTSTIFNLIDSVFSGNLRQALAIYDEQRQQKVEPQAIHGMLVWQMHAVAVAVSAQGQPANQIAKDSGLSPYVVQKSQRIAQRMGREDVLAFMKLLRDIDYRGKHEVFDYDDALRYAILSLAK